MKRLHSLKDTEQTSLVQSTWDAQKEEHMALANPPRKTTSQCETLATFKCFHVNFGRFTTTSRCCLKEKVD